MVRGFKKIILDFGELEINVVHEGVFPIQNNTKWNFTLKLLSSLPILTGFLYVKLSLRFVLSLHSIGCPHGLLLFITMNLDPTSNSSSAVSPCSHDLYAHEALQKVAYHMKVKFYLLCQCQIDHTYKIMSLEHLISSLEDEVDVLKDLIMDLKLSKNNNSN